MGGGGVGQTHFGVNENENVHEDFDPPPPASPSLSIRLITPQGGGGVKVI